MAQRSRSNCPTVNLGYQMMRGEYQPTGTYALRRSESGYRDENASRPYRHSPPFEEPNSGRSRQLALDRVCTTRSPTNRMQRTTRSEDSTPMNRPPATVMFVDRQTDSSDLIMPPSGFAEFGSGVCDRRESLHPPIDERNLKLTFAKGRAPQTKRSRGGRSQTRFPNERSRF